MSLFIRSKRISDPLDERVKARLLKDNACNYVSSGSKHEGDHYLSDSSSLSGLIDAFFNFDDSSLNECKSDDDIHDKYNSDGMSGHIETALASVQDSIPCLKCPKLHSYVTKTAISLSGLKVGNGSTYRRAVMLRLRENGYNAGICKSKWQKSGGLIGGSHEYIDIVMDKERYIVDLEFNEQFKVARASEEYENIVEEIPRIMVGRVEEVKRVVRMMADVSKRMVESGGLSIAPWRKRRYLMNKWFGDYKRTVNGIAMADVIRVEADQRSGCRTVGFFVRTEGLVRT